MRCRVAAPWPGCALRRRSDPGGFFLLRAPSSPVPHSEARGHRPAKAPKGICPAGKGQSLFCLLPPPTPLQSTPNSRWDLLLVCSEECAGQWLEVTLSESLGEAAKGHWHAQGAVENVRPHSHRRLSAALSRALSSTYLLLCPFPCAGRGGGVEGRRDGGVGGCSMCRNLHSQAHAVI